jgi:phosphate transport system ATP-binding protein
MNKISIKNLTLKYSDGTEPLRGINLTIPERQISVIFGPAGGGKSSLLRTLNRLNDLADVVHREGSVLIDDQDIYQSGYNVIRLRREVGMVFARPVVLPLSIQENLTYGLQVAGIKDPVLMEEAVESSLKKAALWEEVKDRLNDPGVALSGGQQQRLCLARVLALEPEVILLDEPTSGLDPISTGKVEESLQELKKDYTIILVPHSVQQAARTADQAAFLLQGDLIEVASGEIMFTNPEDQRTQDYIQGRFG